MENNIIKMREAAGLSQIQLAKKIGWEQSRFSHLELGKRRLTLDVAAEIAEVIGCSIDDLYHGESKSPLAVSDPSFYDTPEFSHILTTTMLMWAEHYKGQVTAERVQAIAKEVYHEMRDESAKAQKSSIKLLFEASTST